MNMQAATLQTAILPGRIEVYDITVNHPVTCQMKCPLSFRPREPRKRNPVNPPRVGHTRPPNLPVDTHVE